MDIKKFLNSYSGLKTEAVWTRSIIAGMTVTIGLLVVALAFRPVVVTIQPWTLSEDAQVTRDDASRSYIEAWGFALAELVGNVSPGNVQFVSDRLKPLLDPGLYHRALEGLEANAKTLIDERISMRFEPRNVTFEKSTGKVYVHGYSFVRHGGSFEVERREPRTYEFTIKIANYAPMITYMDTYAGTPKTRNIVERDIEREAERREKEAERLKEAARYVEPKAETGMHTEADRRIQ